MVVLIKAYQLQGYIDVTIPLLEDTITVNEEGKEKVRNSAYQCWLVQNQFALSMLLTSVTTEVGSGLLGATSARDTWKTLEPSSTSRPTCKNNSLNINNDKEINYQ